MGNWRTTAAGLIAAIAVVVSANIQNGVIDWKTWLTSVGLAAVGYFAKDAKQG